MRWRFLVAVAMIAASSALWPARTSGVGRPGITPVACPQQAWQPADPAFDALPGAKAYFGNYDGGVYRILGRTNVDILKTGGHKVSALEIEEALRAHPAVRECAVVGVPDQDWGERVAAAVVLHDGVALDLSSLRAWAKESLAPHKLPSRLLVLDTLPRNAMGKVMKPALVAMFKSPGSDLA